MNIHKDSQDFCVMKEALTVRLDSCWPTSKLCKNWNFWLSESPTWRVTLRRMAASAASGAEMLQGSQSGSSKVKVLWKQWRWLWSSFVRCCQVSPFPVYKSQFCIFSYYGFASDQHSGKGYAGILSQDPVYTAAKVIVILVVLISMKKLIMQPTIRCESVWQNDKISRWSFSTIVWISKLQHAAGLP